MASDPPSPVADMADELSKFRITSAPSRTSSLSDPQTAQSTTAPKSKLTLETLPLEIKDEIFSHLLLSDKVKCSTDGKYPGHKYRYDTTIMRTSKQMNADASAYLRGHNEFALLHVKFFALQLNKNKFLPTVATGKAARTFKHPAVESTITHLGSTCLCSFGCPNQNHRAKDKVSHTLMLIKDLDYFIRELRLAYHLWPALPTYLQSKPGETPIKHMPSHVATKVKVVWKINPPFRQDLNAREARDRQRRLLAPFSFPMSHGQTVTVVGADSDLAAEVTGITYPRLLSVDALGWDLLGLLHKQKQHLDQLTRSGSSDFSDLCWAYFDLMNTAWDFEPSIRGPLNAACLMRITGVDDFSVPLGFWSLTALDDDDEFLAVTEGSWQPAIFLLVLDCFFTVLRLAVELNLHHFWMIAPRMLDNIVHGAGPLMVNNYMLSRGYFTLFNHYQALLSLRNVKPEKYEESYGDSAAMLEHTLEHHTDGDEFIEEDLEFLWRVAGGEIRPCAKDILNHCKGLLRRPRVQATTVDIDWPNSNKFSVPAMFRLYDQKVAASIIKFTDSLFDDDEDAPSPSAVEHRHDCVAIIESSSSTDPFISGVFTMPFPPLPPGFPLFPPGFPGFD